ncbi:Uncharacterized protein BM_BM193 [Brugia malayi]|uniref:Bm193 n=1 Tax=Brugia malayi TaxID=6279 RepID=A0A0J9XMV6_BRUMA|nr:Uncharacterized protein BM_BM193 [Brugia malayi]CDP91624.1 Bm193 [Brugia malayi]VIO92311.1 Uncharacterized protein BM_BM193 [Brugia malayi]
MDIQAILAASSKEDNLGPRDLIYGSNETTPPYFSLN